MGIRQEEFSIPHQTSLAEYAGKSSIPRLISKLIPIVTSNLVKVMVLTEKEKMMRLPLVPPLLTH